VRTLCTCRICKKSNYETTERLFRYGVRHYVHGSCGLSKWGVSFLDKLFPADWDKLPFGPLKQLGLLEAVTERVKKLHPLSVQLHPDDFLGDTHGLFERLHAAMLWVEVAASILFARPMIAALRHARLRLCARFHLDDQNGTSSWRTGTSRSISCSTVTSSTCTSTRGSSLNSFETCSSVTCLSSS
jgi:hypothetical protein